MGEFEMDNLRRGLVLKDDRFRVVFDRADFLVQGLDKKTMAFFECVPCESLLVYNTAKGWWSCQNCDAELTNTEAHIVLNSAEDNVALLRSIVLRHEGKSWLFVRFLSWLRTLGRSRSG